ncbi:hypothetical protein BGW36DRAFT_349714 [Talaromyces proteolyticus]|uniref:Zn(2)-C6 fungal-type domain-containing protein n=1 Tax=Talaromyces proteolyticus TaxID=1131652 RepID=A0AAD4KH44_9EURO|nr:uncharacterized protein BGW36DRAFT_349714 [Talaromyces proteolyticus]KAH8691616.1 hypothetical protein BGW36DRAFT_349714 [Talaromyces proteolyticus]
MLNMPSHSPSGGRAARGRSCLECRRRKIGCDRSHPCSYCVKNKIQCTYPELSGGPSCTDATYKTEILRRRVDGIDERLGLLEQSMNEIKILLMERNTPVLGGSTDSRRTVSRAVANHENDMASQPIHSSMTIDSALEEADIFSPTTLVSMWQTYLERVDPLIKLFHAPSMQKIVMQTFKDLEASSPTTVCLTYAIVYAAVMSMSPTECTSELHNSKGVLLEGCRTKVDQSLSRVDVLNTRNMHVLQALVLYLICGRLDPKGPNVHGLIGMAIGISIKLHLNRDGDAGSIPPFEIEMRRRLWWHVLTLDVLTAQDKTTDPCILGSSFNTRIPSNVSDNRLDPDMSKEPIDRPDDTEMIFTLARFAITFYSRQFMFSSQFCRENSYAILSLAEKRDAIRMLEKQIEDEYLQYLDESIPLQKVALLGTRLNLLRLKLSTNDQPPNKAGPRYDDSSIQDYTRYIKDITAMNNYERGIGFMWIFEDLLNYPL